MTFDPAACLIRVLAKNGETAGAGFILTSGGLLVTCAHVLEEGGFGPGEPVTVVMQATGDTLVATVLPEYWRPSSSEDIGILQSRTPLPRGIAVLALGSSVGSYGHRFQTRGFPAVKANEGLGASGTIGSPTKEAGFPVVQLMDSSDITAGFSGGPVYDEQTQRIVGMVSGITTPDAYQRLGRTAFMISSDSLGNLCPQLQLSDVCCYKGLEAFEEADAKYFYGRDRVVSLLMDRLKKDSRLLAVLGPSGSGKSSLVKAALIPRLRKSFALTSKVGTIISTRPTQWMQLAQAELPGAAQNLAAAIKSKSHELGDQSIVLLVDQFEELFVSVPPDVRLGIISQLVDLIQSPADCIVVLTMRDDFYGRLSQEASTLLPLMELALANVPSEITEEDLKSIIEKPATAVGLRFEEGLVARIVEDASNAAPTSSEDGRSARNTVLPLLEFSLTQIWEQRQEGFLTHRAYEEIGRVLGGVTQWASRAYKTFTGTQAPLVSRLCVRLVQLGDDNLGIPDTRRRRHVRELRESESDPAAVDDVLGKLTEARILVTSRDNQGDVVEFIHDVLVREWELLKSWLRADKQFLVWHQGIESRARYWQESSEQAENRDSGRLMPDGRDLAESADYLRTRGTELKQIERDYIRASVALRDQERNRLEQLLKETQEQRDEAVRQREIARARQLSAQAEMLSGQKSHDLQKAVILAIESLKRLPSAQAQEVIRRGLRLLPRMRYGRWLGLPGGSVKTDPDGAYVQTAGVSMGNESVIRQSFSISAAGKSNVGVSIAFSPTANLLALSSGRPSVEVLNLDQDSSNIVISLPSPVGQVLFSPAGTYLALKSAGERHNPGFVWVYRDANLCAQIQHKDQIENVIFSRDEKWLATSGEDKGVYLWNPSDGSLLLEIPSPESLSASGVAFSPDSRLLAYVDKSAQQPNVILVRELPTGNLVASLDCSGGAYGLAFSGNGIYLAATGGNTVTLWDLKRRQQIAQVGHSLRVNACCLSPDCSKVATAGLDQMVRMWNAANGELEAEWRLEGAVWSLAWSPDGRLLAAAGEAPLARVFDTETHAEVARMVLDDNTSSANDIAFNHDGSLLAVASNQGTYWVYESLPRPSTDFITYGESVTGVNFFPDGASLTVSGLASTHVWNFVDKHHRGNIDGRQAIFSPNRKYGAVNSTQSAGTKVKSWIFVWELQNASQTAVFFTERMVESMAFNIDGSRIAAVDHSEKVRLWELPAQNELSTVVVEKSARVVAFEPLTGHLVTASWETENVSTGTLIQIWDSHGKELARQFSRLVSKVLAIEPRGGTLALGGYGGAELWSLAALGTGTAAPVKYIPISGSVNAVAFSPDSLYLALACSDGNARIWDAAALSEVARLEHFDVVSDVRFSPDGRLIATGSEDESAAVWYWREEDMIGQALPLMTRNLTPSEWRQELGSEIEYQCTVPNLPPGRDPSLIPLKVIVPLIRQSWMIGSNRRKNPMAYKVHAE